MRTEHPWAARSASRRGLLRAGLLTPLGLAACGGNGSVSAGDSAPSESLAWNDIAIKAVRKGTIGPPMVARMLALLNTAIYDAWSAFDDTALATQPIGKASFRREAGNDHAFRAEVDRAVAYAAYRVLVDIYPAQQADFDGEMAARGLDPADVTQHMDSGSGIGNRAADAVLRERHSDGSNQLGDLAPGPYADYTGYQPVNTPDAINDPNAWQPLRFSNGAAPSYLGAHWGLVKPFALSDGAQLRPQIVLPRYGSADYKAQADAVIAYTANLTDQHKVIAEYWANGPKSETPPGHWCVFAHDISVRDRHTLADDVLLFFTLANAMLDASIVCWDCKRAYNAPRPITAVRTLYAGQQVPGLISDTQGIGPMPGEAWMPYQLTTFVTPPFPEFTSGHSTFSAAGAEILRRFTRSDAFSATHVAATASATHQKNVPSQPVTLRWDTFSAAASEAGLSRLYGGIHFAPADEYGQAMGREVASRVWARCLALRYGQPA